MNVKNPRENRCFQTVIVFSFGLVDNSNKCTVLWKIAARLITVSTSVNKDMCLMLRCLKARVSAAKKEMSDRRLASRLLSQDHVLNHLR